MQLCRSRTSRSQRDASAVAILLLVAAASDGAAQTDEPWVRFQADPTRLALPSGQLTAGETELDFEVGDLDQDGWLDVVVVRKQRVSSIGKRTNVLLMSNQGVLEDKTALYASSSDVPGDQGFLTPTNDRELVLVDVDSDGWLDVVTATTLSDGDPKHLSHPRVYVNLGADPGGAWLGLRHEDARIPQLFTVGGLAVAPRFCDVAAGDLTGDGAPDLHFVDYDSTQGGISEPVAWDLNDRILVNDGNGFFTDMSSAMMTVTQLKSGFGLANAIRDFNGDGTNDVAKVSSLAVPYQLSVMYNQPLGDFTLLGVQNAGALSPYGMAADDLNQDGRIDLVVQTDGKDRFRLNQGNDPFGKVIWGPNEVFTYVGGKDFGFAYKVRIGDLDGDAWPEVMVTDFDVEFLGCDRRLNIYHNLGGVPGGDIELREEAELATVDDVGWKGVVGLHAEDMRGTHDLALGDFDKDGDTDFLLARCDGVFYWENVPIVCQADLGSAGPGDLDTEDLRRRSHDRGQRGDLQGVGRRRRRPGATSSPGSPRDRYRSSEARWFRRRPSCWDRWRRTRTGCCHSRFRAARGRRCRSTSRRSRPAARPTSCRTPCSSRSARDPDRRRGRLDRGQTPERRSGRNG